MLLHLLRLLPGAWTYQCTYFEMNASWRGTATLSSGRASATKSEIFPSYFHMRRHDEWRPCVWRLCASAAWQTNRNKKKKRNNNKYVGTRNTVFIHVYVCVCVCYRRVAKTWRQWRFERKVSLPAEKCRADRSRIWRPRCSFAWKWRKEFISSVWETPRFRHDLCNTSAGKRDAEFRIFCGFLRDSLTKDFRLGRWLLYRQD